MNLENKTAEEIKKIKTSRESWRKAWKETKTLRYIGALITTWAVLGAYGAHSCSRLLSDAINYENLGRNTPTNLSWQDQNVTTYNGTNYLFKIGENRVPYFEPFKTRIGGNER